MFRSAIQDKILGRKFKIRTKPEVSADQPLGSRSVPRKKPQLTGQNIRQNFGPKVKKF